MDLQRPQVEHDFLKRLHAGADGVGIPLAGTFELTPRCNLSCRMCYIRLTPEEQRLRGKELTCREWLDIGAHARDAGMLFLLLTGGEPFVRPDFRELFSGCKQMGLMVSINTNGTMIDKDWLDFFRHDLPFRFNISLYGVDNEAYERLCGRPVFDRVLDTIRALKKLGAEVKLNISLTPENASQLTRIYELSKELSVPIQVAAYMFPPVRRDESCIGVNHRLTAEQAAAYTVQWDRLRMTDENFRLRAKAMQQLLEAARTEPAEQPGAQGTGILCRAGRSSFWINWLGEMSACGMFGGKGISVPEQGFVQAWEQVRRRTEAIRMPAACAACRMKPVCQACAASCDTETGRFDALPHYPCEMTRNLIRLMAKEADNEN